jgi:hypothetical protein
VQLRRRLNFKRHLRSFTIRIANRQRRQIGFVIDRHDFRTVCFASRKFHNDRPHPFAEQMRTSEHQALATVVGFIH